MLRDRIERVEKIKKKSRGMSAVVLIAAAAFFAFASQCSAGDAGAFWDEATLGFRAIYYGRDRDNHDAPGNRSGEIDVDAFGYGLDFRSGYAWGVVGIDASLALNLGDGEGNSEVLLYDSRRNDDSSSASYREAALKFRFGGAAQSFALRGGYTPIRVGTIGTSGGINPHGYRGVEAKWSVGDFEFGYGWADRFHNDWDDRFRPMTNKWHQNRDGYADGERIDYIHSFGARYAFGPDKSAFVDVGFGEGRDFRKNAQVAVVYPRTLADGGALTLTGYFIWGKYDETLAYDFTTDATDEYHFSASARYAKGPWSFQLGYGQTDAEDSKEMQFRLTPWANSDNRNFIQTWAQLDDFVWDGTRVVKIGATYDLSQKFFPRMPGLRIGASFNYGWGIESCDARGTIHATEFDLSLEYVPTEGPLKGWSAGIYPAWLRYEDDTFYGKPSRNDVKFIVAYNHTLDFREIFKK
ncbi:OprD family porin [Synergistaceae bacterium OttesenSCG-928-I11]|nr:OprD family porin [Synergistaceae bacterium OttesenSCG-928-I11]